MIELFTVARLLLSSFMMPEIHQAPEHLYKIMSIEGWEKSQKEGILSLSEEDGAFIHLAKEDQLQLITSKYWTDVPQYVILKLDTSQLKGHLAFENNPGGTQKYYHLYDGVIPPQAVVSEQWVTGAAKS